MESPKFYLVGGANGVGKTTFIDKIFGENYVKILPDRIKEELQIKDSFSLSEIVKQEVEQAVNQKKNIVFEHNLHTEYAILKLNEVKKRGYETNIIFLGIDAIENNIKRVEKRFRNGTGHFVDTPTIIDRRQKGFSNIKTNLRTADNTYIVDNTGKRPQVGLKFEQGVLIERNEALASWILNEFAVQFRFQQALGANPKLSKDIGLGI